MILLVLTVVTRLVFLARLRKITICGPFGLFWLIILISLSSRRWVAWFNLIAVSIVVIAIAILVVSARDVAVVRRYFMLCCSDLSV